MRGLSFAWLVQSSLRHLVFGISCAAVGICLLAGPTAAAPDDDFFTHLHTEKAMANVTVSPGRSGPVDILIQLETVDETPLIAKGVSVTLSDAQTGRKLPTMAASRSGDDGWHVKVASLTAGKWMLGLDISISDADQVSVASPILIK
jgi:copper transport protein